MKQISPEQYPARRSLIGQGSPWLISSVEDVALRIDRALKSEYGYAFETRWRHQHRQRVSPERSEQYAQKVAILLTTEYQEFGTLGAAIITKEQIDQTL